MEGEPLFPVAVKDAAFTPPDAPTYYLLAANGLFVERRTAHRQGNVGPWHRAIAAHDELCDTGLHISAGYVDSPLPEFAPAFVVGRTRCTVPVDTILPPLRTARRAPESWMSGITVACR